VISSPAAKEPTLTADLPGTYIASLTVSDGALSTTSQSTITATEPKRSGIPYLARNGMTVTLLGFTATDLNNGYIRYCVNYKEQNDTSAAIDQATMQIYFSNAEPAKQYGFFGTVLPGSNFATVRSYSFDVLKSSTPTVLEYDADHFFSPAPVKGSLQWTFPIQ
jgi:hypothetical protein